MKLWLLILKNLLRNKIRTFLTTGAVIVLVATVSLIWTMSLLLDSVVEEKTRNVKVILSERYKIFSAFDRSFMDHITRDGYPLNTDLKKLPGFHPDMYTVWHFVGFSLDPKNEDLKKAFFVVATIPEKIATMTDGLEEKDVDPRFPELIKHPPSGDVNAGLVLGARRLETMGKKVGDVFEVESTTHHDHRDGAKQGRIKVTFEIVGSIPKESRWADAGFMDYEYWNRILKAAKSPVDGKIDWGWLQLDTKADAEEAGLRIEKHNHEIKCDTASATWSKFMEPLKPIMSGIKFIVLPSILVVMMLILSNAFSITARERRAEMAVLKVLGFGPSRIVLLVLGECLLVGSVSGLIGAASVFAVVNASGGLPLEDMGMNMKMPLDALWWGPCLGIVTSLCGALVPCWSACAVKPSVVFAGAT